MDFGLVIIGEISLLLLVVIVEKANPAGWICRLRIVPAEIVNIPNAFTGPHIVDATEIVPMDQVSGTGGQHIAHDLVPMANLQAGAGIRVRVCKIGIAVYLPTEGVKHGSAAIETEIEAVLVEFRELHIRREFVSLARIDLEGVRVISATFLTSVGLTRLDDRNGKPIRTDGLGPTRLIDVPDRIRPASDSGVSSRQAVGIGGPA